MSRAAFPRIPGPDDVLVALVHRTLGPVAAFTLAAGLAAGAWLTVLRSTGDGLRQLRADLGRAVRAHRPLGVLAGSLASLLAVLAQACWLGVVFLVGNLVTLLALGQRERDVRLRSLGALLRAARWDTFSAAYTLTALLALLLAYTVKHSGTGNLLAGLVALPGALLGFFWAGVLAIEVFAAGASWLTANGFRLPAWRLCATGIAAGAGYTAAAVYAVAAAHRVRDFWLRPPEQT